MRPEHPGGSGERRISPEIRPTLAVATGYRDDPRSPLDAEHPQYWLAFYAWTYQDTWPFEMWRDFWEGFVPRWPHPDGPPRAPTESLGIIVGKLLSNGSFPEVERALDYAPGSLRRRRVQSEANDFRSGSGHYRLQTHPDPGAERFVKRMVFADGEERSYPLAAEAVLPRVYSAAEGEVEPPIGAYNLLRLTAGQAGARGSPQSLRVQAERARERLENTALPD